MIEDRSKTIAFRVTPKEYDALQTRADEMNLKTISDFLRYAIAPFVMVGKDAEGRMIYYRGIKSAVVNVGKGQMKLGLGKVGRPKKKVEEIEKEKAEV